MRITYCIPFLNNCTGLLKSVEALYKSSRVPDHIVIIDNSTKGLAIITLHDVLMNKTNIHVLPQVRNLGVSASWNTFMRMFDDYIIIANDDVEVGYDTIRQLTYIAVLTPDQMFFAGPSQSGNAFSFFLLRKWGFDLIGEFDENFFPAYFEDNDYAYRMALKGYSIRTVPGATYNHAGSQTLKNYNSEEMNAHHTYFRKNEAYYISKWGGKVNEEKYLQPFDGKVQ